MAQNWAGMIFSPTDPDLADILGRMDLDFENCVSFVGPQISGFPDPQISKFPDFQVPRFPDAAGAAGPGELSDPNLTPLPTHPGIKYVAKALAAMKNPEPSGFL